MSNAERNIVLNPYELGALLGTFQKLPPLPLVQQLHDVAQDPSINEGVVPAYTDKGIIARAEMLQEIEQTTRRDALMAKGAALFLNRLNNNEVPRGYPIPIQGIHPADQLRVSQAASSSPSLS